MTYGNVALDIIDGEGLRVRVEDDAARNTQLVAEPGSTLGRKKLAVCTHAGVHSGSRGQRAAGDKRDRHGAEGRGGRRQLLLALERSGARDKGILLGSGSVIAKALDGVDVMIVGSVVSGGAEAKDRQLVGSGRAIIGRKDGEPSLGGAIVLVRVGTATRRVGRGRVEGRVPYLSHDDRSR